MEGGGRERVAETPASPVPVESFNCESQTVKRNRKHFSFNKKHLHWPAHAVCYCYRRGTGLHRTSDTWINSRVLDAWLWKELREQIVCWYWKIEPPRACAGVSCDFDIYTRHVLAQPVLSSAYAPPLVFRRSEIEPIQWLMFIFFLITLKQCFQSFFFKFFFFFFLCFIELKSMTIQIPSNINIVKLSILWAWMTSLTGTSQTETSREYLWLTRCRSLLSHNCGLCLCHWNTTRHRLLGKKIIMSTILWSVSILTTVVTVVN